MSPGQKITVVLSSSAENYVRAFMQAARNARPEAARYMPMISWCLGMKFTSRATGEVKFTGSHFEVGAMERDQLEDEPVVRLISGLEIALRLPDDLKSADSLSFDLVNKYLVLPGRPGYDVLPRPYDPAEHAWPSDRERPA
jgi:hypothetical protein